MSRPVACSPVLRTIRIALSAGAATLAMALAAPPALAQGSAAPVREPEALEALAAMGKYLRSLKQFAVHADTTGDQVLENGQKVQFAGTVDYKVRQPDRLRADVRTDRVHRQFFYDGATLTQYAPKLKLYGAVKVPATIDATLQVAADELGITLPLADMFYWGTPKSGVDALVGATFVGKAMMGGVDCDHYAFRQADVDWQVWIAHGDKPLPMKLIVTTLEESSQPQFTSVLKWDTKSVFGEMPFRFSAPRDAHRIGIASGNAAVAPK
ncbi:MAG: DUF2092 domain-containing protein [Betaproteobacteria bacterium]|nr:DUF2092 domain-containing protein [Betaproteobacteria bacterium]